VRRLWQPIFSDRIVGSSAIVREVAHLPSDFLMTGCAGMWPGSVLMAFCARSLSAGLFLAPAGSNDTLAFVVWHGRLHLAPTHRVELGCYEKLRL
jgi:hypothetical protein